MMLPVLEGKVIAVVGWKGSGKTRVVEGLVKFFNGKGLSVATIKHAAENIEIGEEAKDSGRHLAAGAQMSIVISDEASVIFARESLNWAESAARFLARSDVVIVEGFKQAEMPKIVVKGDEPLPEGITNIVAFVAKEEAGEENCFSFGEIDSLGEFLLKNGIVRTKYPRVSLVVNGRAVPLNDFVRKSLAGVITGFITTLKRIEKPRTIELTLGLGEPGTDGSLADP